MKNLFYVSVAFCIFTGTASTALAQGHKRLISDGEPKAQSPKFIESIEMKPDRDATVYTAVETPATKNQQSSLALPGKSISGNIEKITALQFKYAQVLDCNVEFIKNISLYNFIDEWWETRYRYGGTNKSGIDCSAFTSLLMTTVFGLKIPRTAKDQYNECAKLEKDEINEGDLVFFNTRGGVSHVGLYLSDGYFVHASTSSGVIISNLSDPYYNSRFIGGGRVLRHNNDVAGNP